MAAAQVTLARVEMRGSRAAVERGRAPLLAALDRAPWPEVGAERLLFIRHLSLRGTPQEIAWHAAEATRQLAAQSVDAWLPAADQAAAVHFASRAAQRACLLVDLLAGRAGERWFWRREQRLTRLPPGSAIVELLAEEPLLSAEILARVERTPFAGAFWRRLDNAAAGQIVGAIGQAAGWALPAAPAAAERLVADAGLRAALAQAPASWHCLFGRAAGEAVVQLAALLLAWQRFPALLGTPHGARLLAALAYGIAHGTAAADLSEAGRTPPRAAGARSTETDTALPERGAAASAAHRAGAPPARAGRGGREPPVLPAAPAAAAGVATDLALPAASESPSRRPAAAPARAAAPFAAAPATTGESDAVRRLAADDSAAPALAAEHDFLTRCGGLFYLLNFLALAAVQARLDERAPAACGWRWLVRLGYCLGLVPDPPLTGFLAAEIGLDDPGELATLPPLPAESALLQIGMARYGPLFSVAEHYLRAARVVVTRSHVDVHFRLADASLPVRRAGLDVNPGWLPWLGRVVSFHYGSGDAPPPGFPP